MRSYGIVIIGSGFGGQCAAIRLLQAGETDFRILERRDFMGGTWCQNRYPGAAVDVPSPLYSISSEPFEWSRMFADQAELEAYTRTVIERHDLRAFTDLGAEIVSAEWDAAARCWLLRTRAGAEVRARIVINATGPLSTPVVPAFPGLEGFAGRSFHTNQWDRDYDLRGRRVAIIGTGASAAQVIPAIAGAVETLHVFQRTPHWVMPRRDRRFTAMQRRLLRLPPLARLLRWAIYWGLETRVVGFKYSRAALRLLAERAAARHLETQIADPALRRKLRPNFTLGCKRVILSDTYYPALARRNVRLHDRDDAIAAFNERGLRTVRGEQIDLDLVVWSTGYDATDGLIAYPVTGTGGRLLSDVWAAYPRAYLGTAMPGFPNFFVMVGPNTGIGHTSAIFVIEAQINYVMATLAAMRRSGSDVVEVRPDAEAAYTAMIHREMERTVWKSGGCDSWYKSRDGHVIAMFPGFSFSFWRLARRFEPGDHRLS